MVRIRLFEEQVNELYTRALMPGLAHLYSGQEAVGVGICEVLRIDYTDNNKSPIPFSSKNVDALVKTFNNAARN